MNFHPFFSRTFLVKSLWLLAVCSLVFFVGITVYKGAQVYGLPMLGMPELELPKVVAIQSQLKDSNNPRGNSNPFDAGALHWSAQPRFEMKQPQGVVGGVMLLPDVSIALTAEGPVKAGGALAGGTLSQINAQQLTINTPEGLRIIDMPAKRRPGMAQINKAPRKEPSKEKIQ